MKKYYVTNVDTEVAVYEKTGKIVVINNCKSPRETDLYIDGERKLHLSMSPMEMRWIPFL